MSICTEPRQTRWRRWSRKSSPPTKGEGFGWSANKTLGWGGINENNGPPTRGGGDGGRSGWSTNEIWWWTMGTLRLSTNKRWIGMGTIGGQNQWEVGVRTRCYWVVNTKRGEVRMGMGTRGGLCQQQWVQMGAVGGQTNSFERWGWGWHSGWSTTSEVRVGMGTVGGHRMTGEWGWVQ